MKTRHQPVGWISQASPTSASLAEIVAVNEGIFFAAGDSGTVLKTTDGGAVWRPLTTGTNKNLGGMSFVDFQTGWVCGDEGTILRSTDGGDTWNTQHSSITAMDAFFLDEHT